MANQTYKTLQDNQTLRTGDEWENKGEGDWTMIPNCLLWTKVKERSNWATFRRPIKVKAKRVKKTPTKYCYLTETDTLLATDEWAQRSKGFKDWEPVRNCQVGDHPYRNIDLKYRRKVEVPVQVEKPSRPTYYILTQEDKIEEGDEYFDKYSEKWEKSEYVGSNPPIPSPYRRLVK
jgi:hypothetical protein